ncbi:CYTH domain-containing protein [Desulfovibrio sp. OttesenSCG-928-G11]|nr:CYTH domain-containing protein [Desulfovibrio sp. OttesenSCG-928-G11]
MRREIERKFLLAGDGWRGMAQGVNIRQGYLCIDPERVVRVRLAGDNAWLTIKGASLGAGRLEYELPIACDAAGRLLDELALRPLVEKIRYAVPFQGLVWEVDEFTGLNQGLILAEVELENENQQFERPAWIGKEVTGDPRYYNVNLVRQPFSTWRPARS